MLPLAPPAVQAALQIGAKYFFQFYADDGTGTMVPRDVLEERLVTGLIDSEFFTAVDARGDHFVHTNTGVAVAFELGRRGGVPVAARRMGLQVERLAPMDAQTVEELVANAEEIAESEGYPMVVVRGEGDDGAGAPQPSGAPHMSALVADSIPPLPLRQAPAPQRVVAGGRPGGDQKWIVIHGSSSFVWGNEVDLSAFGAMEASFFSVGGGRTRGRAQRGYATRRAAACHRYEDRNRPF